MPVRVKICGITRPEDARAAAEAGASAIGMVFWPGSPRCVSAERAIEIAGRTPDDVIKVGVFVDQPRAFIDEVVRRVPLDAIQLHGREVPADFNPGTMVLKAVPVGVGFDPGSLEAIPGGIFPLLDVADAWRRGGTGIAIDWAIAARAAAIRPIVLAGGLNPANVRAAIAQVDPFAVDVSTGVESAPGQKNAERIHAFVAAVREEAGAIPRGRWA